MSPYRYKIDLSNEVLIIDFGQGALKISDQKWMTKNVSAKSAQFDTVSPVSVESADVSFERSIFIYFGGIFPRLLNDF